MNSLCLVIVSLCSSSVEGLCGDSMSVLVMWRFHSIPMTALPLHHHPRLPPWNVMVVEDDQGHPATPSIEEHPWLCHTTNAAYWWLPMEQPRSTHTHTHTHKPLCGRESRTQVFPIGGTRVQFFRFCLAICAAVLHLLFCRAGWSQHLLAPRSWTVEQVFNLFVLDGDRNRSFIFTGRARHISSGRASLPSDWPALSSLCLGNRSTSELTIDSLQFLQSSLRLTQHCGVAPNISWLAGFNLNRKHLDIGQEGHPYNLLAIRHDLEQAIFWLCHKRRCLSHLALNTRLHTRFVLQLDTACFFVFFGLVLLQRLTLVSALTFQTDTFNNLFDLVA